MTNKFIYIIKKNTFDKIKFNTKIFSISRYKLKIISWYTILFSIILFSLFTSTYFLVGFRLEKSIDKKLATKIKKIEKYLASHSETSRSRKRTLDNLIKSHRHDFEDLRETTDLADNKFLLFVFRNDKLIYISHSYRKLKKHIEKYKIKDKKIITASIRSENFRLTALNKTNYIFYLGYETEIIESAQEQILEIFFFVLPVGIVLSILCGFFVTQKSLNVIKEISTTAQNISSTNLDKRIKEPKGNDEINDLIKIFNSMISRLEESFNSVKNFSFEAAHEIRTPLTIIRGELEELSSSEKLSDAELSKIDSILEEINYLSSIAEKLLLVHNLEQGEPKFNFIKINLSNILESITEDAKVLCMPKHIDILFTIEKHLFIKGNQELIIRLLWNIIDNAVKYSEKNSKINVIAKQKNKYVIIEIIDNGIGIPNSELKNIFKRFYRVDKSHSRNIGGSGLGLAICEWIMKLHKGEITVKSKLNSGSTFSLKFPQD